MPITADSWLAAIFGHEVFRVEPDASPAALAKHERGRERAFYYAKVDTAEAPRVRELCAVGYYPVDVNVAFSLDGDRDRGLPAPGVLGAGVPPPSSTGRGLPAPGETSDPRLRVGELVPGQEESLLAIAGSCFRFSRFHLDPAVPRAVANRIKRDWIANYIRGGRGEALLVASWEGHPAGFLAVLASRAEGKTQRVLDLIGVDEKLQGRGIGLALTRAFIARCRGNSDELLVGTQAANTPSLRLYHRAGFEVARTSYVLHRHVLKAVRPAAGFRASR